MRAQSPRQQQTPAVENWSIDQLLSDRMSDHRRGSADYFLEITRSPVAVRALKQFRVIHLLGFQSSSTSTSAFLLFSCASGSRDQSPSNNHFPSGERLDRIRWTASLTRSSSPYPNFARTLRPCRAS